MSFYALEHLTQETGDVLSRTEDVKIIVDTVAEHLRRLLSGSFFLDEEHMLPERGVLTSRLLHQDDARRFVIVACAWAPQQTTPIHDHASWGVIGGLRNRIIVTSYRRLDDGEVSGVADVHEVSRVLVSESSLAHVRAPDEQIHKLENPFRDPAVTVHVFGDLEPWRNMFEPSAKTQTPFEPADNTIGI